MPNASSSYDDRPQRSGRKGITTYLTQDVAKRLKMISVESDRTLQQVTEEAIIQWIERHGKKAGDVIVNGVRFTREQYEAIASQDGARTKAV